MITGARVALATCATRPAWEVDDRPLEQALGDRGARVETPIWDDPAVDWSGFDAVLIRSTWDYQQKHAAFLAWAEQVATQSRLFNPPGIVRWNTHKSYLRQLGELGVPLAPSVWLRAGEAVDLGALLRTHGVARGFFKPVVAANARGTRRVRADDPQDLAAAQVMLDGLLAAGEDMILQPYLASVETEGELSVIDFDGRFSHGVRKVPVAGDYRVQNDHGARDEPWIPDAEARALVEQTLGALAALAPSLDPRLGAAGSLPLLYARVDLLRTDAGALVLNELEVVEPSLFFRHGPQAAAMLAEALLRRL